LIDDTSLNLYGIEAAGHGVETPFHAATLTKGNDGILHGAFMKILQSPEGNIKEAHSISAGLDYPGVGPEHCHLHATKRVTYKSATDREAISAFKLLTKLEGIIPALESAHAIAGALHIATHYTKDQIVIINLSGRGDKDMDHVLREDARHE
jgi:tryptophan synthase beta chain